MIDLKIRADKVLKEANNNNCSGIVFDPVFINDLKYIISSSHQIKITGKKSKTIEVSGGRFYSLKSMTNGNCVTSSLSQALFNDQSFHNIIRLSMCYSNQYFNENIRGQSISRMIDKESKPPTHAAYINIDDLNNFGRFFDITFDNIFIKTIKDPETKKLSKNINQSLNGADLGHIIHLYWEWPLNNEFNAFHTTLLIPILKPLKLNKNNGLLLNSELNTNEKIEIMSDETNEAMVEADDSNSDSILETYSESITSSKSQNGGNKSEVDF